MARTFTPEADRKFHQEQNSNTPDQIYVAYTPFFAATNEFLGRLANMAPEQQAISEHTPKNKSTCR